MYNTMGVTQRVARVRLRQLWLVELSLACVYTCCTEVPVFVRGLSSQTAIVGQSVEFSASVNASPPAALTWLVNGFALSGL